MIIGVTGTYGAGKDAVAEYLIDKGFNHYSLSNEIREVLKERGIAESREALIKTGNELRETEGPAYLAERVSKKLSRPAVITSIRNPREIDSLKMQDGFVLIHVDADRKVRYERTVTRSREGDVLSFEEFVANEEKELLGKANEQNLSSCFEKADHIIYNDGTIVDLHVKIEKLIEDIGV